MAEAIGPYRVVVDGHCHRVEGPGVCTGCLLPWSSEQLLDRLNAAYVAGRASPPGGADVEALSVLNDSRAFIAVYATGYSMQHGISADGQTWHPEHKKMMARVDSLIARLASTPTVADVDARYARLIKAAENLRAEWTPKYIANSPLLCAVVDVITALAALAGGEVGNGGT